MAPHMSQELKPGSVPPETFVWHFKVKVSSKNSGPITLGALEFPAQLLTIVLDEKGRIGVSNNLFEEPIYSGGFVNDIKKDIWQDIYLLIDEEEEKISIYVNNNMVMSKEWIGESYPLSKIWLGTIWLKGAGNYDSLVEVAYDEVILANKGELPRLSYFNYLASKITSILI